jgi:hypothetical protein
MFSVFCHGNLYRSTHINPLISNWLGEALINNGKVQETYYKYDTNGNLTETKTLFPTRDYAVFSGTFTEPGQTAFEFDLTGLTITDGILKSSMNIQNNLITNSILPPGYRSQTIQALEQPQLPFLLQTFALPDFSCPALIRCSDINHYECL